MLFAGKQTVMTPPEEEGSAKVSPTSLSILHCRVLCVLDEITFDRFEGLG